MTAAGTALVRAVGLFNAGQVEHALACCSAGLADHPGDPGLLQMRASLLLSADDPAGALAAIAPVLAAHPDHAPARRLADQATLRRAIQCIDQGRPAEAAGLLRALTLAQPAWVAAGFALALAEEDLCNHDAAAAALQQVLASDPGHAQAWLNLGLIEQARGRLDAAVNAHAQAWAIRPLMLGRIAMALCSQRCGAVWIDDGALAVELSRRAPAPASAV